MRSEILNRYEEISQRFFVQLDGRWDPNKIPKRLRRLNFQSFNLFEGQPEVFTPDKRPQGMGLADHHHLLSPQMAHRLFLPLQA